MVNIRFAAWFVLFGCPAALAAGGSYLVDDAEATPEGACQVETWVRGFSGGADELSTTPACTRNGIEYSLTATRVAGDAQNATAFTPGLKWVTGDVAKHRWAIGLAATTSIIDGVVDNTFIYVPISAALDSEAKFFVHANIGYRHDHSSGDAAVTGLGIDWAVSDKLDALAEVLRVDARDRTSQAGVRWSESERFSIDLIYGRRRYAHVDTWWTLGVNLVL
jgi:hypothetical protein